MTPSGTGSGFPGQPVGYCTACGSPYSSGQAYCGHCGSRVLGPSPDDGSDQGSSPSSAPAEGSAASQAQSQTGPIGDEPYGSGATTGAVLLTVFLPLIALIVALALRSAERGPKRRQFLKNWAIGSAAWLCTGWLIPIIAFSAAAGSMSGCRGGIDQMVPPSYESSDGVHWQATYSCMNGGTETKSVPASQVPGGGTPSGG